MRIAIEAAAPEAAALAELLAGEGHDVAILDLDESLEPPDVAYLDVWTPETAPRVARLRAAGARLTCLADLILERAVTPTLGVTGTAGKTTTAAFAVQLLRAAGVATFASETARAGNLWPTAELLPALERAADDAVIALELTSSHLAFTASSPTVAVITSFWPDHLELHGSLAAYRHAKEAIARRQRPTDRIVLPADDEAAAALARDSPAGRWWFSAAGEADRGAFLRGAEIVLRDGGDEQLVPAPPCDAPRLRAVVAAAAAALALGVPPERIDPSALEPPPFRARTVARRGATLLVDDGMAATPAKTAATLRGYPERSVVLVAGGEASLGGLDVHASPEELRLLDAALDEVARAARAVVLFGSAAGRLAAGLGERGLDVRRASGLDEAVGEALAAGDGAAAVLVSPMFPLALADRERIAALLTVPSGPRDPEHAPRE